jgi:hypothetical protein
MEQEDRIIAVGLLTGRDREVLGQGFKRVFPLGASIDFSDLLRAIDKGERRAEAAKSVP